MSILIFGSLESVSFGWQLDARVEILHKTNVTREKRDLQPGFPRSGGLDTHVLKIIEVTRDQQRWVHLQIYQ